MVEVKVGDIVRIESNKYKDVVTFAKVEKIEGDKIHTVNSISSLNGLSKDLDDWRLTVDKVSEHRTLFRDDQHPIKELVVNIKDLISEDDFSIYHDFFKSERSGLKIKF